MNPEELKKRVDDLAHLTPIEYEAFRKRAIKETGMRPTVLDKEVERQRKFLLGEKDSVAGSELKIEDAVPWDEEVNGAALLSELSAFVKRFVIFQKPSDADTLALWLVATYCCEQFSILPYLGVTAPSSECGKTTALEILLQFACRACPASSVTGAIVYRVIDAVHPTLLIDELDSMLVSEEKNKELIGIFNAGHKRAMAWVHRCVGDDSLPRRFNCFGPKAYGMIGKPPLTMRNRSILVNLFRKGPAEKVEKFNLRRLPAGTADMITRLCRQAARWAKDNVEQLQTHVPDTSGLGNRAEDNWEPLLTIADLSGGDWPGRAREAAKMPPLHQKENSRDLLLRDVRNIFHTRKIKHLPSAVLVKDLLCQEERPWNRYRKDHDPIDSTDVADLLGDFEIKSKSISLSKDQQEELDYGEGTGQLKIRGYKLADLQPVFDKFLTGVAEEVKVSLEKTVI
jgi:putative DNA primase/helicase